jgi:exopolyphosphatase/guanosine-5'-triphosphate,3'-diphosphate pyrophosphatase
LIEAYNIIIPIESGTQEVADLSCKKQKKTGAAYLTKYAVLDIGTNTTRLMSAAASGAKIISSQKHVSTTRLGDGLIKNGLLSEPAMQRTIDVVSVFLETARKSNPHRIFCFATSAVRCAKNGKDFADRLKRATGLTLDILSGEQEALVSFTGALGDKTGTVIDIGGGSTEVITGSGGEIRHIKSLDIGVVRMLDRFSEYDPANVESYYGYIDGVLKGFEGTPFLGRLTGVSGTVTTAAAIKEGVERYSPQAVEGRILTIIIMKSLLAIVRISNTPLSQIKQHKKKDVLLTKL